MTNFPMLLRPEIELVDSVCGALESRNYILFFDLEDNLVAF